MDNYDEFDYSGIGSPNGVGTRKRKIILVYYLISDFLCSYSNNA